MNPNALYRRFGNLLGTTPFHPQFFSKRFLKKQVTAEAGEIQGTLLDLGCGHQPYRHFFRKTKYFGLDHPGPAASGSPDIWANIQNLPLADASVDIVLCTQVLEHVDRPTEALAETFRILKPKGRLFLSVPFIYPLHDEPHDFFRYSSHGLKAILTQTGFEPLEIQAQGGFIPLAGELLNLFCLHQLNKLFAGGTISKAIGALLAPFFLTFACLNNFLCLALSPLDRDRRFVMNFFVVARKKHTPPKAEKEPTGAEAPENPNAQTMRMNS